MLDFKTLEYLKSSFVLVFKNYYLLLNNKCNVSDQSTEAALHQAKTSGCFWHLVMPHAHTFTHKHRH